MFAYLFLILVFVYSSYFNRTKRVGVVIFLILFVFCFFRGINVGIDTEGYYLNDITFGSNGAMISSYDYELLTLFFRNIIVDCHLSPRVFLYGVAIVTYFFFYKASKSFNVNLVLFCLFFYLLEFFFHSMNIARQMAATGIILYAYSFLNKKEHYYYFPLILLASSIHFSSVLFIFFYFIRLMPIIRMSRNRSMVYVLFSLFFFAVPFFSHWLLGKAMLVFNILDMFSRFGDEMEINSKSIFVSLVEYINLMIGVNVWIWLKSIDQYKVIANLFFVSLVLGVLVGNLFGISRILLGISAIRLIGFSLYFEDMRIDKLNGKLIAFNAFFILNMYLINSSILKGNYGVYPYYMTLPF